MKVVVWLRATAAIAGVAALALSQSGCSSKKAGGSDGGGVCTAGNEQEVEANCACQTAADCTAADPLANLPCGATQNCWACTGGNKCERTCASQADCADEGAGYVCQFALCLPPACADDKECPSGQQCVGGSCEASITAVSTCEVLPANALLNASGSKTFWVVSKDGSGNELPFEGAVTWTSSITGVATTSTTSVATFTNTGTTASSAPGTIGATAGGATCTAATVSTLAAISGGALRVTVVDSGTGQAITDATVKDGAGNTLTSNSDGTYSEENPHPSGTNTVSVFHTNSDYVTVADTGAADIYVPLTSSAAPGKFSGTLAATDFNNLSVPGGSVHLDITGGSIAGNLIDLSLSTLLGATVPTVISAFSSTPIPLPDGIAIGLSSQMFKATYSASDSPGVRAVWDIGGNAQLNTITMLVTMVTGGGSLSSEIGPILTAALPILSDFESGVTGGVTVSAGEMGSLTTTGTSSGTNVALAPDTFMRVQVNATLPTLPTYYLPGDTQGSPSGQLTGAFVIGGALADPQGLVPLGLTAGVNCTELMSCTSSLLPNVIVNSAAGGANGMLSMYMAPRHGGIDGSPFALISLAADIASLGSAFGSSSSSSSPLVLSGTVVLPGAGNVVYTVGGVAGGPNQVDFTNGGARASFLGVPDLPTVSVSGRALTMPATDVANAKFHRLDVGSDANEWQIYFPAGTTSVAIPAVPSGFVDHMIEVWAATETVGAGLVIRDPAGHYWQASAGTTGSTMPTWPTSPTVADSTASPPTTDTTVTDGSVTWSYVVQPTVDVQTVTLGLNGNGANTTYTYDGVVGFQSQGVTVDDLTWVIDQFSVEGVTPGN